MLETYTNLSNRGYPIMKVVLLLGLDNGIQASPTAVNEELDFVCIIGPSPSFRMQFTV